MQFLTIDETCDELKIGRSALRDLQRDDETFPKYVVIQNRKLWITEDIVAWKNAKTKAVRDENARRIALIGSAK